MRRAWEKRRMIRLMTDPRGTWLEVLKEGPGKQRKFEHHPLRLHFGSDQLSRPLLMLRVDDRPAAIRLGDAVSVEVLERVVQGEWSLVLTLLDPKLTDTFIDLCIDLADRSSAGSDEAEALTIFRRALEEFRDLLTAGRGPALSLEELRGLIAELWFALHVVAPASSAVEALIAWAGPLGAPQDFRFPDGSLVEIKAIHSEARAIKISSPEQLDPVNDSDLELVTIGLEECPPGTSDSVSLPGLMAEFKDELTQDPDRLEDLDRRLRALGVAKTYQTLDTPFLVTASRRYEVTDGFPRIRRDAVALGIERLKYEIEIRAIRDFAVSDDPLDASSEA